MTLTRTQTRNLILNEIKKERIRRKKYINACNHILKENKTLIKNNRYFTQQEINEGIFDTLMGTGGALLGNLLPGLLGDVKQKIATQLLRKLGLNPKAPFGRIVINVFEEIEYTKVVEYFSDWKTGCPKFIEYVLKALSDSLMEYMLEKFLGAPSAASQSGIAGTVRETFTTTINDKIIPSIAKPIESFICGLDMGQIIEKIKGVASGEVKVDDILPSFTGGTKSKALSAPPATDSATSSALSSKF